MSIEKGEVTLSVVVIGRNEGCRLVNCLDSIHQITYPKGDFELIYVDSRSTDDSVDNAKSKGAKVIEIDHSHPNAALARNTGWNAAKGKFVLFLDSDTVLHPQFISIAISEFKNPDVGVVSGNLQERHPDETIFNRVFDLDWNISTKDYCGGNALIRRDALEKINGYNPKLIAGEEPEMCQRLKLKGYVVKHIDVPMASHDLNITSFRQYWRRCFRSGYAYASIGNLLKNTPYPLWKMESRHNLIKGSLLIFGVMLSIFSLFTRLSFYLLALYLLIVGVLVLRTTLQKGKNHPWNSAFFYGLHAHFQHIPMFFGQLSFWFDTIKSRNREVIEYK